MLYSQKIAILQKNSKNYKTFNKSKYFLKFE